MKCHSCSEVINDNARFCRFCGEKQLFESDPDLDTDNYIWSKCSYCGTLYKEDESSFCENCGAPFFSYTYSMGYDERNEFLLKRSIEMTETDWEVPRNLLWEGYSIPDGAVRIGNNAFSVCEIRELEIPESVTEIGAGAFSCSALETVFFSENITKIGRWAFCHCKKLTNIVLPPKLEVIDDLVFYGCDRLSSVDIPASVKEIGHKAFGECVNLKSITIHSSDLIIDGNAFDKCKRLKTVYAPSAEIFEEFKELLRSTCHLSVKFEKTD